MRLKKSGIITPHPRILAHSQENMDWCKIFVFFLVLSPLSQRTYGCVNNHIHSLVSPPNPPDSLSPFPLSSSSLFSSYSTAFFFTPEDGLSLCLHCDLVVHPTSGPGWERFMIFEQRVSLPKNVMEGKCGGCAGKCKQCRKRLDEAQSHAAAAVECRASPCVTPTQDGPTPMQPERHHGARSCSSDLSSNRGAAAHGGGAEGAAVVAEGAKEAETRRGGGEGGGGAGARGDAGPSAADVVVAATAYAAAAAADAKTTAVAAVAAAAAAVASNESAKKRRLGEEEEEDEEEECDDAASESGEDRRNTRAAAAGRAVKMMKSNNKAAAVGTTTGISISEVEPALVVYRSSD